MSLFFLHFNFINIFFDYIQVESRNKNIYTSWVPDYLLHYTNIFIPILTDLGPFMIYF